MQLFLCRWLNLFTFKKILLFSTRKQKRNKVYLTVPVMLELPYKEMELETSNKKMGASTGRCAVRDCSTHAEGEVFIKASPQGLGIHAWKEGEGWLQEPEVMVDAMKTVFQTYQAWCTYELTETVAACTRPAQDQARSSSALREKCTRSLSPNQKTSATDTCWQRKN